MEKKDKQFYLISGFLNGTRMDNSLQVMLTHLQELLKFTMRNDLYKCCTESELCKFAFLINFFYWFFKLKMISFDLKQNNIMFC